MSDTRGKLTDLLLERLAKEFPGVKHLPDPYCPACGDQMPWSRPFYSHIGLFNKGQLIWTCKRCGFHIATRCNDA